MTANGMPPPDGADKSLGEIVSDVSEKASLLVREEIELAKAEMAEKGKKAGVGAGMFGAAAVFAAGAFAAITAGLIWALSTFMVGWVGALIVGVVYAAIAGVLALRGKKQVQQATPPVPEGAVDSTKEDLEWLKTRAKSGRSG